MATDRGDDHHESHARRGTERAAQPQTAGADAEDEKGNAAQTWINALHLFCGLSSDVSGENVSIESGRQSLLPTPPSSVRIVLCGHLSKRGEVNTSYKRRWFSYTSDAKISYYQDTAFRGCISLEDLESVCFCNTGAKIDQSASRNRRAAGGEVVNMTTLTEFAILTKKRIYYLQADSPEEASRWVATLTLRAQAPALPR
jgi:hypothetical protein